HVLLPIRSGDLAGHNTYHGIYAAAAERGLAIALHAWGLPGLGPGRMYGMTTTYVDDYLANSTIVQRHVASLVAEGVFTRFAGLTVVLAECGFTWLPCLLWWMDKGWKSTWHE